MTILTKDTIKGFVGSLLSGSFDEATESPSFHEECWEYCCSKQSQVAIAAPRQHAKTSGVTLGYGLASLLFRDRNYLLLVSDTEAQSSLFLGLFKQQLQDNEELKELFGIVGFEKETETDIIVMCKDRHKFRIMAKGAEQKLRGLIWEGKRPDLILCHEKDTDIYTPETGWIKNQDFPGAKEMVSEAYKITYEDGTVEVVSEDHRYYVEGAWKYPWEMKTGDNVEENINDAILNVILKKEKLLYINITLLQKLKNIVKSGLRVIWINTFLVSGNTTSKIKKFIMRKLRNLLETILPGKLLIVPKGGVENSTPFLLGCPQTISKK